MINAFIGFSQKLEDVVSRSVNKGSSRVESKSIVLINLLMSDKWGGGSQRKRKWCCCSGRDFPAPDLDFAPITWLVFLQSPQLSSAQHSFLISLFLSMKISVNETESRFLVENSHRQLKKRKKILSKQHMENQSDVHVGHHTIWLAESLKACASLSLTCLQSNIYR